MKYLINIAIKTIFPPKCILCEKIVENDDTFCEKCWEEIIFIKKPYCDKCSSPFEFEISEKMLCGKCFKTDAKYIKLRSAVSYNSAASKIILKFKFYDKMHLKRFMAKSMVQASQDIINDIDILIPIPLHKKRLNFRKYNQSLLLADEIGKITDKKVIYNFLMKTKNTKPQSTLKRKDRIKNLENKFIINEEFLKNIKEYKKLNFALVDDVVTTGTTANECIKVLNKAGIKNVYMLSFAKTNFKN